MKSINTVIEFFLISQILKIEPVKIKTAEMEEEEGGGGVYWEFCSTLPLNMKENTKIASQENK